MIDFLYAFSYGLIGFLVYALLRGGGRLFRAVREGHRREAGFLALAGLRISLLLAGLVIIVATHGRGIKIAQSLMVLMIALGLPNDFRRLRGQ